MLEKRRERTEVEEEIVCDWLARHRTPTHFPFVHSRIEQLLSQRVSSRYLSQQKRELTFMTTALGISSLALLNP